MAVKHKTLLINGFLCGTRDDDAMVRASSLSCLGELCKVLGFRLGHALTEVSSLLVQIQRMLKLINDNFNFVDSLLHIMYREE